jgi:subtilisin family serine protease
LPRSIRRLVVTLASLTLLGAVTSAAPVAAGTEQTYLVLYKSLAVPADAATRISAAGGTLRASYGQIGVAVAVSASPTFAATLNRDARVAATASTATSAVQVQPDFATDGADAAAAIPATDNDTFSGLQWDMMQIHTPEAHAITGGDPGVVVGDIDTGLDWTHPDLAANVDFSKSVSCLGGVANTDPAAWMDEAGHGTHTAGTIAAASNGIGIVGVAPNVKVAGIRAGNADGFFFPESVVCAFMWAGTHGIDVTNNSYFADPWLFNCKNDAEQRAIFSAEQRAIRFAQQHGVLVVASEGNQSDDLAHPTQDRTSPDDTTPVVRDITNACEVVPVEVPGVLGVTANGNRVQKSYYSSYGMGTADVIAPGGDRRFFNPNASTTNGRVLSTYPAAFFVSGNPLFLRDCSVSPCAVYAYLQGTSMAGPHVAGVAALIASQHPSWTQAQVAAAVMGTADPMACPADMSIYANFPAVDNGAPQVCTGGAGYNSFNGHGQVNALTAVQR